MPFDDTQNSGGGGHDSGDIATVAFFLFGAAKERQIFNGHTGHAAFDAFARLLKQKPDQLWDHLSGAK